MWTAIYDRLHREGRPAKILLLIGLVVCMVGFEWRRQTLGELTLLDARPYYSAAEVRDLFKELGAGGRNLYAITQLTLDVVFPLVYGALAAIILIRLSGPRSGKYLMILPAATVAADLLENVSVVFLIWSYREQTTPVLWSGLARAASAFTAIKWLSFFASVLAILATAVIARRKFFSYVYLLRVPVLTVLSMVGIHLAAFYTPAGSLLANLFDVSWAGGPFWLSFLAFITAWTVMITWRLVLLYGPERFDIAPYNVSANVQWRHIFFFGLAAVPIVYGAVAYSSRSDVSEILEALLGLIAALGVLWAATVIHKWFTRPAFSRRPPSAALGSAALSRTSPDMFLPSDSMVVARVVGSVSTRHPARRATRWILRLVRFVPEDVGRGYFNYKSGRVVSILPGQGVATILFSLILVIYAAVGGYRFLTLGYPPPPYLQFPTLGYALLLLMLLCWGLSGLAFFLDRFRIPVLMPLVAWLLVTSQVSWSDHFYPVTDFVKASGEMPSAKPAPENPEPIIVVAANGGGIQAAAWTARVLAGLQKEFGESFGKSIRVISSVSGGSVGAMYFLSEYSKTGPPAGSDLDRIVERAQASSLGELAWGVVYPDFLRVITSFAFAWDRGRVFEEAWLRKDDRSWNNRRNLEVGLSQWREDARSGRRPGAIFNATITDTGRRLPLATVDLPVSEGKRTQDHLFETLRGKDISVVTAARLSASFPYVSPAARADVPRATGHVVDGGYYDNYGLTSLVEWLDSELERAKDRVKKVLVVRIHGASTAGDCGFKAGRGWFYQAFAPVATLLEVRNTSHLSNGEIQLRLLMDKWKGRVPILPVTFEFDGEDPPLSWHLNDREKEAIRRGWEQELSGKKKQQSPHPELPCERIPSDRTGVEIVKDFLQP